MKKIFVLCLTVIMLASLSVTAFATGNDFVSSPSGNPAPVIVSFEAGTDGCKAKPEITPYSERDSLGDKEKESIEKAFRQIAGEEDDKGLSGLFKKIAERNRLSRKDLAVSDLFDIGYKDCAEHKTAGHKGLTITLEAETLKNILGLLYFDGSQWKEIEILEHDADAGTITFYTEDFGTFAFVVNKYLPPYTGDNSVTNILVIVAALSALTLVISVRARKREA